MSIDHNKSNNPELNQKSPENIESGILNLEKKLAEQKGISVESIQELKKFKLQKQGEYINSEVNNELTNFKENLQSLNISPQDKEILSQLSLDDLRKILDDIHNLASKEIHNLKGEIIGGKIDIIPSSQPEIPGLSPARLARACNPTKPHHHIDGIFAGTYNSCYNLGKNTVQLCIDTIKFPYHCYQIISGKATTDAFEKI